MKIDEQIKQKLEEAIDILKKFGMPSAQQNERTAYCLLSLLNVTPEKEWKNAENPLVGITPMMLQIQEKLSVGLVRIRWYRQGLCFIILTNQTAQ